MSGASEFGKDEGVIHETVVTGRKAGWDHKVWSRLAENEGLMRSLLPVIMGQAHVVANTPNTIDLGAPPFVPDGWKVESHQKGGAFELDPSKVALHLESEQVDGKSCKDTELQGGLEGKTVFNAVLLDWCLAHTDAIPESWKVDKNGKTRYIFFWGTTYRHPDGNSCIRYLCWKDDGWGWGYGRLKFGFIARDNAWLRAS